MLDIMLSFEELKFDKKIDYFGMDIAINNVNSDEPKLDTVLCWANPTKSYYCPAKFGKVYLKK